MLLLNELPSTRGTTPTELTFRYINFQVNRKRKKMLRDKHHTRRETRVEKRKIGPVQS